MSLRHAAWKERRQGPSQTTMSPPRWHTAQKISFYRRRQRSDNAVTGFTAGRLCMTTKTETRKKSRERKRASKDEYLERLSASTSVASAIAAVPCLREDIDRDNVSNMTVRNGSKLRGCKFMLQQDKNENMEATKQHAQIMCAKEVN